MDEAVTIGVLRVLNEINKGWERHEPRGGWEVLTKLYPSELILRVYKQLHEKG